MREMFNILNRAVEAGLLRRFDLQFACRMIGLAVGMDMHKKDAPYLMLATALVSHRTGEGDVCVALNQCENLPLFQPWEEGDNAPVEPPPLDLWLEIVRRASIVGGVGEHAPLILDDHDRLYLGRYWHFEYNLAEALKKLDRAPVAGIDRNRLHDGLVRLLPDSKSDEQRMAARMAVLRPLSIISGGPGSGKTYTVSVILSLLLEQNAALRIVLAAPTGKAAARLVESIRNSGIECGIQMPKEAVTLHRLLGFRPGRATPKHGPGNPLHLDVLVVDEVSMVDLPLMARLMMALPDRARLILLGDKDQLTSVEAGKVFGDLCDGEQRWVSELKKSWRFRKKSGIGALAEAVNDGDANRAVAILNDPCYRDVTMLSLSPQTSSVHALPDLVVQKILETHRRVLLSGDPKTALDRLKALRLLSAVREGPYGVLRLNRQIEQILKSEGVIQRTGIGIHSAIYAGRPVMVTVNDYAQQLYNGDVGLILQDSWRLNRLQAFFETEDRDDLRRMDPSRLPPHETVYAMTVHKSQGSEFDEVLLVLPDRSSNVVTRELLYTGITRAKRSVTVLTSVRCFKESVRRRVVRSTGLRDALRSG